MLMAESWHKKPENARRYFRPSPDAITGVTSLLGPGDRLPFSSVHQKPHGVSGRSSVPSGA